LIKYIKLDSLKGIVYTLSQQIKHKQLLVSGFTADRSEEHSTLFKNKLLVFPTKAGIYWAETLPVRLSRV